MEKFDFNRLKGETDTLIGQRKFIQATNKLEEVLEKFPGKPEIYFLLGRVYQHIDIEASIRSYQKGLSFDANHVFLNISLGFLYFNRKEYSNAEKYLRTIWVEDPTNIRLLTALGKALQGLETVREGDQILFNRRVAGTEQLLCPLRACRYLSRYGGL